MQSGNKALGIPPEILGPMCYGTFGGKGETPTDPATILGYYFSTRGALGRVLQELKLIGVGRGGAGKTSLIRRLNGLSLDPDESETHGINISPLTLKCEDGPVTARVWDFGGQHVLHAMHEFFLTARSLYLLVLGEREDMAERDAAYWLQLIRSYAGAAPVVVALKATEPNGSRPVRISGIIVPTDTHPPNLSDDALLHKNGRFCRFYNWVKLFRSGKRFGR